MSKIEYIKKGGIGINCIWGCDNNLPCKKFCWARNIARRFGRQVGEARGYSEATIQKMISFEPVFLPDQLRKIGEIKKPSRVFMNWMGETFNDKFIKDKDINMILPKMFYFIKSYPQHQFFFLTKNPYNFMKFYNFYPHLFTSNIWIGVSVMGNEERATELIKEFPGNKFISIEPLMRDIVQNIDLSIFDWVIVGGFDKANKYKKYGIEPTQVTEWVKKILGEINTLNRINEYKGREPIKVWMKNNLEPFWTEKLIQELPELEGSNDPTGRNFNTILEK